MELKRAETAALKGMIERWVPTREFELEATFDDVKETTTFTSVYQRLEAVGFKPLGQELKLNICTPEQIRFSLTGDSFISNYCRDDTITDKLEGIEIMRKQNISKGQQTTFRLEEYGVKVKLRQEVALEPSDSDVQALLRNWERQPKAFRLIQRWSFEDKQGRCRFDLSIVRSTPVDANNQFKWQTKYQQIDLAKMPPKYEVEVEILRPSEEMRKEILASGGASVGKASSAAGGGGGGDMTDIAFLRDYYFKGFLAGIGEVLRGIQKHSILIRRSVKEEVLKEYAEMMNYSTETIPAFRGVAPITLMKENMEPLPSAAAPAAPAAPGASSAAGGGGGGEEEEEAREVPKKPNIRSGYNVTDKADGLRMMGFVNEQGELFLLDMSMSVYRTGLIRPGLAHSLVDGEFVTKNKEGSYISSYYIFDIYVAQGGKDISQTPFQGSRYEAMIEWVKKWNEGSGPTIAPTAGVNSKNKITIVAKNFLFADRGLDIFKHCASIWNNREGSTYYTDGLILTPNNEPIPEKAGVGWKSQLKWKPSVDNSVDFLVYFEKDPDNPSKDLVMVSAKGATKQYKVMRLFVGSSMDPAYTNPRGTILNMLPLPGLERTKARNYQPVPFNPRDPPDTMAGVCYREIEDEAESLLPIVRCEKKGDELGDPIEEQSIVEMRYEPQNEPGWRWIPMRVRYDKTERFKKGLVGRTMNKDESANGVWESIHDPVTEHMITTGDMAPSAQENVPDRSEEVSVGQKYYERAAMTKEDSASIRGLRSFHRLYVKEGILWRVGLMGGNKFLVDLACGQGGDLASWVRNRVGFVYGNDLAGFGITDPQNGIYRRYLNELKYNEGYDKTAPMIFTIGSSAKRISTGDAGETPEEKDIMRYLYGNATNGVIPKFVYRYPNILRNGANCVSIMFALHYFFDTETNLDGFLQNVNDSLKIDGYFIGCCFDGAKVFETLKKVEKEGQKVGMEENKIIWRIKKKYSQTVFPNDETSLGMPIEVEFMSIGTTQTEYLVNFEFLKKKMSEIGCDLLTADECKKVGLQASTNTFDKSYAMALQNPANKNKYFMSEIVKEYSFLNRWFIFKRRRPGKIVEDAEKTSGLSAGVVEPGAAAAAKPLLSSLTLAEQAAQEQAATGVAVPRAAAASGRGRGMATGEAVEALSAASGAAAAGGGGGAVDAVNAILENIGMAPIQTYTISQVIQFFINSEETKDPIKQCIRYFDPITPFDITDPVTNIIYPSVYHYYMAKMVEVSNKPLMSNKLYSKRGSISQQFQAERQFEQKDSEYHKSLANEKVELKKSIKAYDIEIDEGRWRAMKLRVLLEGYELRLLKDKKFVECITNLKSPQYNGKTLLYYVLGANDAEELGGRLDSVKGKFVIKGQNLVGRIIMHFRDTKNL